MEAHVAMAKGTTEYFWGHFEHYHPVLNDDLKLGLFFSLCTVLATCVPIVMFWLCFAASHLADLLRRGEKEFDEEKEIGPGEERPLLGAYDFREDYGTTGTHIIRIAEPRTIRTVDGHDIYYISEMSW